LHVLYDESHPHRKQAGLGEDEEWEKAEEQSDEQSHPHRISNSALNLQWQNKKGARQQLTIINVLVAQITIYKVKKTHPTSTPLIYSPL
jgi:hypothetical protein